MSDESTEGREGNNPFHRFRVEMDPERLEEGLREIRDRIQNSAAQARYTRVRLSYKSKQVGPDIPLTMFLAGQGVLFLLTTPLAAVLANVGAKAFLDVELVHEADELVQEGIAAYLDGEIELAERKYREALKRRDDDPAALYNLGTLLRVQGRNEEALTMLRRAAMGPEGHPDVVRASEAIERITSAKKHL